MSKYIVKESVRGLVEFVLKSGSIDNRFSTSKRAIEGIRAHQKLQKSNEEIFSKYEKEVYLSEEIELEDFLLKIEGRADGIIYEDDIVLIEEIKSTYRPLLEIDDKNELHWAQAKVYAYIYAIQNNKDKMSIQLSYYQLESDEVKSFRREYTFIELKEFLFDVINKYQKYVTMLVKHKDVRNRSIKKLKFPFPKYREGQLKFARAVYGTLRDGKILFAEAPTGIGKTVSTLFPSIKAIGEGIKEKIFYLDAKYHDYKENYDSFFKDMVETASNKYYKKTRNTKYQADASFIVNCNKTDYNKNIFNKKEIGNFNYFGGASDDKHSIGNFVLDVDDDNMFSTWISLLLEWFCGYTDICWNCGNNNPSREELPTKGDGNKYHYTCEECGSFWVDNFCYNCQAPIIKHDLFYKQYHIESGRWMMTCPKCGKK